MLRWRSKWERDRGTTCTEARFCTHQTFEQYCASTPTAPLVSCDLCSVQVTAVQKKNAVLTNTTRMTMTVDCTPKGDSDTLRSTRPIMFDISVTSNCSKHVCSPRLSKKLWESSW